MEPNMHNADFIKQWQTEETAAFQGWDFSHIDGRYDCPAPPWDYKAVVQSYLKDTDALLDMGTGGGEFLLTIGHPHDKTFATESYVPNYALCKRVLSPLGISVVQTYENDDDLSLPFGDVSFDVIINRHNCFDLVEVSRALKPGGYFITQQVGDENDREFIERLMGTVYEKSTTHSVEYYADQLKHLGFEILQTEESLYPVKYFDVGALVYHAKQIPWQYPGFSVKTHLDQLLAYQKEIEASGYIQGTGHRFLIVARK